MESKFLDCFYHDVWIEKIELKFNVPPDNENSIIFDLELREEYEEKGATLRTRCTFENVYYSSFSMYHNFTGSVSISLAEIDNSDNLLIESKEKSPSYMQDYISKLNCYCIYTSNGGCIKILSKEDVSVKPID